MKTLFKMIGIAALMIGLAACSELSANPESVGKEEIAHPTNDEPILKTENQMDESVLQEKARYHADLTDGELVYRLYLFADDETSWVQEMGTYEAAEGDLLYEGTYQVALGLKGEETFFVQDQLDLSGGSKIRWNETNPSVEIIGGNILAIYQPESSNVKSAILLSVDEGKVKNLAPEDGLFLTGSLKQINDTTYQTALYSNSDPGLGWNFFTYQKQENGLKLIDKVHFTEANGALSVEAGIYWHEKWVEKEDFYVSYRDLRPEPTWLKEAEKGSLVGIAFPLHTPVETIRQANPHVIEEGYLNGGPYLAYPMERYSYSETTGKTVTLEIPGNRVDMKADEFIQIVGNPDQEGISDVDGEWYAIYQTGENQLWITADSPTGRIHTVQLFADKW